MNSLLGHKIMSVFLTLFMGIFIMSNRTIASEEHFKAPDFPPNAGWLNTERALAMKELEGRVVLLDFWTYCCINCMHVLPDLARLEKKYGDRLVVIGIHSAKFEGEKDTDNIRDAVLRYNIHHPVVNDSEFILWKQLGIRAWPTMVLIDTEGYLVGKVSGEGNFDMLDRAIGDILNKQTVSIPKLTVLPLKKEQNRIKYSELYYPGKILADGDGKKLFIADSGHNRIVVADMVSGEIMYTVGSGKAALEDGGYSDAAFSNPQGMALSGTFLYVADTDNHALRVVNLMKQTVATVTGDGHQGRWQEKGGKAGSVRLNSPWDIVFLKGKLYIAMAGSHQLWYYDPATGTVDVFAGSGREDIMDGSLETAALAQPSGITTDGEMLYFADSETSSIRKVSISEGKVITLVGSGLFDFGHRDGSIQNALLQHPLGIAWAEGALWIADTYNNRIKRLDTAVSAVQTVAGSDEDGLFDDSGENARFDEPGGVTYYSGNLYVADTNNHEVRVIDTTTGNIKTLPLSRIITVADDNPSFEVRMYPPEGYHINEEAPSDVAAVLKNTGHIVSKSSTIIKKDVLTAFFTVPIDTAQDAVEFSGDLYICDEGENAACYVRTFSFLRKIKKVNDMTGKTKTEFTVSPPDI